MKTPRRTLRGIVTSSMLTLALAVGMMPAGALAFAAEQTSEDEATQTEELATEQDAAADSSDSASSSNAVESSASEEAVSEDTVDETEGDSAENVSAEEAPAPAASATPAYTATNSGITSADVPLTSGAEAEPVAGTIEYAGIAYTINPDNPDTVSVTGLATDKPKGDVQIQSQVASDGKLYTVAAIEIARGGVHR